MLNLMSRSCIGILAIVISGCATIQIPAWVEGKSTYYTNKNHILGLGVGQNQSVAQDNASRKITQQFKSVSNSDDTNSQVSIIFNLIKFEETWLNTDTGKYHVLAYISRSEAASLIRNKMLKLDELTYQFFEQAKGTSDLLEQTSYIDSAINSQTRRLKFKPVLKIVSTENEITSSYNIERLSKVRDQLQIRINLKVDIIQDKLGEIENIIKNSLDAAGFIRNDNSTSQNHLKVELTLEKSEIPQTSGELLMQGTLITSLKHKGDATVRGFHEWRFSTTAKDHESLVRKSREILIKQLNADLKRAVMSMMVVEIDTIEDFPNQDYVDIEMPEFNTTDEQIKEKTSDAIEKSSDKSVASEEKSKVSESSKTTEPNEIKTESAVAPAAVITNEPAKKQTEQSQDIYAEPKTSEPQPTEEAPSVANDNTQTTDSKSKDTSADTKTETTIIDNNTSDSTLTDTDDPISTLPPLAN